MRRQGPEEGSVLLFVIFVCLAVAVLVQTLAAVVLCADLGLAAEAEGREQMDRKESALAALRERLLSDWESSEWRSVESASAGEGVSVQVAVSEVSGSGGWVLAGSAREPALSPLVISGWVERGRDGVDLPLAGLVADEVVWRSERVTPWLELDPAGGSVATEGWSPAASARLRTLPAEPLLGPGINVGGLEVPWRLDGGWQAFFERVAAVQDAGVETSDSTGDEGMGPGAGVLAVRCRFGKAELPPGWGISSGDPGLLVVTGAGTLDARGRGELFGVIVVQQGDALLEGTTLHGALLVGGRVDLGATGTILYSRTILRRATDRSLVRTRLVPGTRSESTG